jgi:hypothetical protein
MEMTRRPGERRFYAELLTLLGAPQRPRTDRPDGAGSIADHGSEWRAVIGIDEVHNILAGTCREQRIVLNTLRFLGNRLQISNGSSTMKPSAASEPGPSPAAIACLLLMRRVPRPLPRAYELWRSGCSAQSFHISGVRRRLRSCN